jgi:glycosyltransferase involved in cell wall biosynthesis
MSRLSFAVAKNRIIASESPKVTSAGNRPIVIVIKPISICPSWAEGFGLTSAEALACKCSLVSTNNGGNRNYAVHEKTALLSPPKDPRRLAENLVRVILDRELSENLARAGFERVHRFTWDYAVDKIETIFSRHV